MGGGKTSERGFLGLKAPRDFFSIFLDAMHYGSPSGGGGWHSLYNLIRETQRQDGIKITV